MMNFENKLEREFELVYRFLQNQLPMSFNSQDSSLDNIRVNEEIDDDPHASFLMTFDEFNSSIPKTIQAFLLNMDLKWIVTGSFDIRNPFDASGKVITGPSFQVSKSSVSGDLDLAKVISHWGLELVDMNSRQWV
jgi:hypothetical protein